MAAEFDLVHGKGRAAEILKSKKSKLDSKNRNFSEFRRKIQNFKMAISTHSMRQKSKILKKQKFN